jgi:hypothetical protein
LPYGPAKVGKTEGNREAKGDLMPLEIQPEYAREKTALRVSLPKALEDDLRLYQKALGGESRASLNHIIVSALRRFLVRDKEFQKYRAAALAGGDGGQAPRG